MSQHTLGRWVRQGQWNTDRGVAECIEVEGWGIIGAWIDISNEPEGNINLIASVSDLFEACQAIKEYGLKGQTPDGRWPYDMVVDALAKLEHPLLPTHGLHGFMRPPA